MEVDLEWDEEGGGYRASYYSPDKALIDQDEGNGDIDDFYSDYVEDEVAEQLDALGVVSLYALIRVWYLLFGAKPSNSLYLRRLELIIGFGAKMGLA